MNNSHLIKVSACAACNKYGHRHVNGPACPFVMFVSLQGKLPTKKATVLNKVNKAPLTSSGPDGESTENMHTQENIVFTQNQAAAAAV